MLSKIASLEGKVALITGGTAGIGEAAVQRFTHANAKVAFTGRDAERGAAVAAATGALFIQHEVSDEGGWPNVIGKIVESFGRLDVAFANAGLTTDDADIERISPEAWRRIMDVNVTGAMLTCQHAIAAMKENPGGSGGSIVINSSVAAMQSLPGFIAYTASKGALRSLAKGIAAHCARQKLNIRCNSIHPGNTDTRNMRNAAMSTGDYDSAMAFLSSFSPLERLAEAREIANVVAFLASDEASYLTGSEILIDGGTISGLNNV